MNHIQYLHVSISTPVEFNSFKISFSLKIQTIMNCTKEIRLMTLVWRRKKRRYCAKRSKTRFWVRDTCTRRKQHGEFHWFVQQLKLGDREFFLRLFTLSSSGRISSSYKDSIFILYVSKSWYLGFFSFWLTCFS